MFTPLWAAKRGPGTGTNNPLPVEESSELRPEFAQKSLRIAAAALAIA